jgi:hypothetical protein
MDDDLNKSGLSDIDNHGRERAMQKIKIALPVRLLESIDSDLRSDETRSSRIRELLEVAFQKSNHEPGLSHEYFDKNVERIAVNVAEIKTIALKLAGRIEGVFKERPLSRDFSQIELPLRGRSLPSASSHEDIILAVGFLCIGILVGCWLCSYLL